MRCRKHPTDFSSAVGVCATCLRERLFTIIAAQANHKQQSDTQQQQQSHPLPFPRSVSPYISRRKSDTSTWQTDHHHRQRFHSTPQVGSTGSRKSKGGRFSSLFFGLFGSKSRKPDPGSDPSWFSSMVSGSRKTQMRTFSLVEGLPNGRNLGRGMSPARFSEAAEEGGGSSGYSSVMRTPARVGKGGNLSSAFCLSPLVRPSPNRNWGQRGVTPETVVAGETRVPARLHLSQAPSFCKNRSRKLADIGRCNYNPNY